VVAAEHNRHIREPLLDGSCQALGGLEADREAADADHIGGEILDPLGH
jgi:hypothetical protein